MRYQFLLPALLLCGCSTTGVVNTAPEQVAIIPSDVASQGAGVAIVASPPAGAVERGKLDAYACQKYNYDPQPNDELAIAMLKAEAAKVGATSIAAVKLSRSNVDVARNCFTTIHAQGLGYS